MRALQALREPPFMSPNPDSPDLDDLELEEFHAFDDHPRILLRTDVDDDDDDLPPVRLIGVDEVPPKAGRQPEGRMEDEDLSPNDRPTIPVPPPRDSGIRLAVTRVPIGAATVDAVLCDLSRDPRSENWVGEGATQVEDELLSALADPDAAPSSDRLRDQNERPPSTSIVRALK
jgi:hypothetical protein